MPPASWNLREARMPALSLLDALRQRGFEGTSSAVTHSLGTPPVFDDRTPISKKNYFRCVLACEELFAVGIVFKGVGTRLFYAYLLKYHKLPLLGKTAKELMAWVNNENEEEAGLPILQSLLVEAPKPAIALAIEDDDIAGDDYPEEVLPAVEVEAIPLAPCEGGGGGGGGGRGGVDAEGYETDADLRPVWPEHLVGVRLRVVQGKHDGRYNYHSRLAVDRCNPEHRAYNRSFFCHAVR